MTSYSKEKEEISFKEKEEIRSKEKEDEEGEICSKEMKRLNTILEVGMFNGDNDLDVSIIETFRELCL